MRKIKTFDAFAVNEGQTVKATYVSVWEGGVEIRTSCKFDKENKIASDIKSVEARDDDGEELEMLDREYVEADGETYDTFTNADTGDKVVDGIAK